VAHHTPFARAPKTAGRVAALHAEVGLIGYEGMSGTAVVLGGDQSPRSGCVQIAGEGQRIAAKNLRGAMNASVL
jgi:hypothetical protein